MSDFGRELTRLMAERGVGVRQLARAVFVNPGHLSSIRGGKANPSAELAGALDDHLGAGGQLAAVAAAKAPSVIDGMSAAARADLTGKETSGSGDPARAADSLTQWDHAAAFPIVSVLSGDQAGPREIAHLEEMARMFRAWDHEHGGGIGRQAVIGQLSEVAALLGRAHPAPLRKRLLGVASMLALTIASMSADSGNPAAAYRYLGLALDAAREARDPVLGARAANAIARRQLDDGDHAAALMLLGHARSALRALPPAMTAMLSTSEAWAAARLGDYGQMSRHLDQAVELAGDPDSLFGAAELAGIAGACFEALAAQAPLPLRARYAAEAEQRITEALGLRQDFYARTRVLDLAGLANVRLCQDEPVEAIRVAGSALESAAALRSGRAARRVHAVAIRALEQFPRLPEVADFADTVRSRLPVT